MKHIDRTGCSDVSPLKRRSFIKLLLCFACSMLGGIVTRHSAKTTTRRDLPLEAADLYGPHNLAG